MPKPQYGTTHKKARRIAIDTLIEGTPCRYCGRPMYKHQSLDLDHIVPVALGGANGPTVLTHSYCNRSMGSRTRARRRRYARANYALQSMGTPTNTPPRTSTRPNLPAW